MGRYDYTTPGVQRAGLIIREAREAAGLTRPELSKRAKVSVPALQRLECGYQVCPNISVVGRVLAALRKDRPRGAFARETIVLREIAGLGGASGR